MTTASPVVASTLNLTDRSHGFKTRFIDAYIASNDPAHADKGPDAIVKFFAGHGITLTAALASKRRGSAGLYVPTTPADKASTTLSSHGALHTLVDAITAEGNGDYTVGRPLLAAKVDSVTKFLDSIGGRKAFDELLPKFDEIAAKIRPEYAVKKAA